MTDCLNYNLMQISTSITLSATRESLTPDSNRKRYLLMATLANLILLGNFCPIDVKVQRRKTSASSNEIADLSRKNGRRSNAHRYDKDRQYSCSGELSGKEAYLSIWIIVGLSNFLR